VSKPYVLKIIGVISINIYILQQDTYIRVL